MKKIPTVITYTTASAGVETVKKVEGYQPADYFKFSEEGKKALLNMLKEEGLSVKPFHAMGEKVPEKWFFLHLDQRATMFLWMQEKNKKDHRDFLTKAKENFKDAIKQLKRIEVNFVTLSAFRNMPESLIQTTMNYVPQFELEAVVTKKAKAAQKNLDFIIKTIEKYKEPKYEGGHRPLTQFCIEIAKLLTEYFDNVKLPKTKGSFFERFCTAILKEMNISQKNISSSCYKAIDEIRQFYTKNPTAFKYYE